MPLETATISGWVQHNQEIKRLSKPDNSNGASTRVRAEIGTVYDKKHTNTPVCSTSLPSGWPQDKTRTQWHLGDTSYIKSHSVL